MSSAGAPVLCGCGHYTPDVAMVMQGYAWTCPGCTRRWVKHQDRI